MSEHRLSPSVPWTVGSAYDHHINGYGIYASGCRVAIAGYLGGTETAKHNARFIVKAVNNHDALVKHLYHLASVCCDEDALRLLDSLTDAVGETG